ncbi:CidA/LrgA family protein [Paraclostridium sordellii]|uniref:CidA/LrgA family protein n=1 Tax=Paraclostridium sordellii TaxID=1505 RepID=UPI0005E529B5|nr:CidA/LrgA family protein [Paeniclostridium sordellii]CEP80190.1 transporter [[Clostridium] sordellii] [Paeniclostridium sordellii]
MKLLRQLALILIIWAIGEYISSFLSHIIIIPGSIIGMILLFVLLKIKVVKVESIEELSNFFLDNMAMFFVPAGVSLIKSLGLIGSNVIVLAATILISTTLVMVVTAIIVEKMIEIKSKRG